MANDKIASVILRYSVDKSALSQSLKSTDDLKQRISGIEASTDGLGKVAAEAQQKLVGLANAGKLDASSFVETQQAIRVADVQAGQLKETLTGIKAALNEVDDADAFESLTLQAKLLENEIAGIEERIQNAGRTGNAASLTDRAGNASSALSGFAGAAGLVSPELAGVLQGGADITGAIEQLKQIPSVFGDISQAATQLPGILGAGATAITGTATAAAGAAAPLGATAAGIVGVTVAAAPFVIAAAAVVLAIKTVTDAFAAGREGIGDALDAERSDLEQRIQLATEAQTLSSAELAARQQQNEIRRAELQAEIAQRQAQIDEINRQYEELGAAFDPIRRAALGEAGLQFQSDLADMQGELNNLNATIENDTNVLGPQIAAREVEQQAIADAQTAFDAAVQARVDEADLIRSGTSDAIQRRIQAIQDERAAIEANLSNLPTLDAVNDARERMAELDAEAANLTGNILPLIEAREAEAAAIDAQLSAIQDSIQDETEFARLRREATVEQVEQRQQAIADEVAAIQQALPELEALAGTSEEAAAQLAEARARLGDLREESNRLTTEVAPEARRRQVEEANAAIEQAESQSKERQLQITQDAAQKAIDLARQREDSIRKATEDADKAFRELAKKNNKAIDDENKRYKEDEAKAVEQYRRDELKSQQQHQKDRLRAQQDLQDSLLSAEEDNDVIAFIRAKRSGDEQLKRMDDDAQEETRIRSEQFAQERADAAAAHAEKLEQIKQATIEERDAIMARKDEAIAAANAQFDEQKRRLDEQTQQAIAREREQLQRSLENIRQKYNVEQTAGRQAAETIKQAFLAAAQAVKSQVDAAGKGGGKGGWDTSDKGFGDKGGSKGGGDKGFGDKGGGSKGGGKGNSSFGQVGGKKKGFAEGGIVPAGREVIGRFEPNRSYPEAVLPLDPATIERVFAGVFGGRGGGGSNITVNVGNVTVPESSGVTIQDVKVAVETGVYAALEGINEARAGA